MSKIIKINKYTGLITIYPNMFYEHGYKNKTLEIFILANTTNNVIKTTLIIVQDIYQ